MDETIKERRKRIREKTRDSYYCGKCNARHGINHQFHGKHRIFYEDVSSSEEWRRNFKKKWRKQVEQQKKRDSDGKR